MLASWRHYICELRPGRRSWILNGLSRVDNSYISSQSLSPELLLLCALAIGQLFDLSLLLLDG